jgi:hypothetical protein
MSSKIISYDLCAPGRNYDELYKAIKAYGTWAHITESTWFIKTDSSCVEVRDKLLSCLDKNDRLFVGELTGVAAWSNALCDNSYLKQNL